MHVSTINRLGWLLAAVLGAFVVASLAGVVRGGPLDPPGAPTSTLPQVEPRIPIRQPSSPAGFPITISAPGSYFLTQDITATAAATDGITITVSGVTLDLNGFTLSGAGLGSNGVSAATVDNVTIINGTIRNWTNAGIQAEQVSNGRYERVRVNSNPGGGIIAGRNSIVQDCTAADNGGNGIRVAEGALGSSIVARCIVDGSVLDGIQAANNTTVTGNGVTNNGVNGIHTTGAGNRVDGNHLGGNIDKEIRVDTTGSVIIRNTFSGADSDLSIAVGNSKGPTENAGTPLSNPWANIAY